MAKQNETGHAINVDNMYELIQFVLTYGATYNPTLPSLQSPQLTLKQTAGINSLQAVTNQVAAYNEAGNIRVEVFAPVRPLATRVINFLEASGASPEIIKDARAINRKLQGKRATTPAPVPPGTPPPPTISASQMSFAQTIEHWGALISLLQGESLYTPNEEVLSIDHLIEMRQSMVTANDAVAAAWALISEVRNQRDVVLYSPQTGIVATAALVKKYVKALYGAESPEFKQINHIKFRTFKRD